MEKQKIFLYKLQLHDFNFSFGRLMTAFESVMPRKPKKREISHITVGISLIIIKILFAEDFAQQTLSMVSFTLNPSN